MRQASEITEEFLRNFKAGDLVDVKGVTQKHRAWNGPYKILEYKLEPPVNRAKRAAHISVDFGKGKRLERWLMVGDQQIIRHHVAED